MDSRKNTIIKICVVLTLLISITTSAQGTLEDYKRSVAVDSLFKNKVYNTPKDFHWLSDHVFWYQNNSKQGLQYIRVDARSNTRSLAFDHQKMAQSLSEFSENKVSSTKIEIRDLSEDTVNNTLEFKTDKLKLLCDLTTYKIKVLDSLKPTTPRGYWGMRAHENGGDPVPSPDGKFSGYIKNYNLYVKNL